MREGVRLTRMVRDWGMEGEEERLASDMVIYVYSEEVTDWPRVEYVTCRCYSFLTNRIQ